MSNKREFFLVTYQSSRLCWSKKYLATFYVHYAAEIVRHCMHCNDHRMRATRLYRQAFNDSGIREHARENTRFEADGTRSSCNALNKCNTNPAPYKPNSFQTNWIWSLCSQIFFCQS